MLIYIIDNIFCFQYNVYKERKNNNIRPYMPSLEERIKIKKEYMNGH